MRHVIFLFLKAQSAEENTVKKLKDGDEEADGKMEEELTDN